MTCTTCLWVLPFATLGGFAAGFIACLLLWWLSSALWRALRPDDTDRPPPSGWL